MNIADKTKKIIERLFSCYEYKNTAEAENLSLYSSGELRKRFYKDGFLYGKTSEPCVTKKIISELENILSCDSFENGSWESKYKSSFDLRPSLIEVSPLCAETFLNLDLTSIVRNVSGRKMMPAHIQLRKTLRSQSTYNGWHRDTHFYKSGQAGNIPPAIKIIIFPKLSNEKEVCLNVIPGSHLAEGKSWLKDFTTCLFERKTAIENSNDSFLIFDTALLHSAIAVKKNDYCPRLICSFVEEFQLSEFGPIDENKFYNSYLHFEGVN